MFHNIPVNEKRQKNNDQTKPQAHFTQHNNKLTTLIVIPYPTALNRQLLSEGITLLAIIPSILYSNTDLKPIKKSQLHQLL